MKSEVLLSQTRKHLWAAWALSAEELASQAAATLLGLGMLVPEGGAAELERLRKRVAELETERHSTNEALDDAAKALRVHRDRGAALAERLQAGQEWQRGRNPELVSENLVSQSELRAIFGIPLVAPWGDGITQRIAPTQALREDEPTTKCRCDEPGAAPYSCEADDCHGEFPELNPFGGGPAEGHDAKVSRQCGRCGWRTSVWHVADGSAEEELHGHVTRVHGGTASEVSR